MRLETIQDLQDLKNVETRRDETGRDGVSRHVSPRNSRPRIFRPTPIVNNVGVMYALLTFVADYIMKLITDFYIVKVSYKVHNKVGNKSQ